MILPTEIRNACARLVCTLCLLENNPELIEPDVLNADREKFERTGDEKYIEKAKRRGKIGWNVGRGIEVIPHVRRPHLALVWHGRGKARSKIIMRKLIHRDVIERVPTGYQDEATENRRRDRSPPGDGDEVHDDR